MTIGTEGLLDRLARNIDLGHVKRNKTFLRQVARVCSSPGTSTPQAAARANGTQPLAAAMSMYRFAGNEGISLGRLREARAKTVLEPLPKGSDLLVIHDVSCLDYSSHNCKEDRRRVGNHFTMGYEYVSCLAVDPNTTMTLGVVQYGGQCWRTRRP